MTSHYLASVGSFLSLTLRILYIAGPGRVREEVPVELGQQCDKLVGHGVLALPPAPGCP